MITRVFILLILILFDHLAASVTGQTQIGFISIDCGSAEHLSYDDSDTGIKYMSDNTFINTGERRQIATEYQYPNNPTLPFPLSDLRSFPNGNKNCYSLKSSQTKGSLNLIRASFLYGNYDNENKLPEFDLYLDVSYWFTVKFRNASDVVITEVISVSQSDTTYVCLINKGLGIPFISSLELRPLTSSIYNLELGTKGLLVLFNRFDVGYTNGTGRYKDDEYDRIWKPYGSPSWETFTTSLDVNVHEDGYRAPQEVIRSFAKPSDRNGSLELQWNETDAGSVFYVYLYFAELEQLVRNQSRQFNVSWNGLHLFGPISPRFRYAAIAASLTGLVAKEHRISIHRTFNSTLPPILNGIEVFTLKPLEGLSTYDQDVVAITSIMTTYQLTKELMGDPCGPRKYVWEGLECSYSDTVQPRIISLNLSSNSLTGVISTSMANLTSIQILDLSNNRLSGSIPDFLGELQSLRFLNLKNNNLFGPVPASVLLKSRNGLKLLVDDQNACLTRGSCKKKNITTAIIASVTSTVILAIIVIISLWFYRKWKSGKCIGYEEDTIGTKKRKFTYIEIVHITDDFKTVLGKGGFGSVYLGQMTDNDGTQVAVKMLSSSSSQGSKEFRAEAELLLRVHHRNLASFVGYCDENNNMALIYEYMANGNLRDFLSDNNNASCKLSWEVRIRIAIDSAQGLEYLHHGCKPPIVHRDVKSSNILLSANMDAKIADFGLSIAIPNDEELTHVSNVVMGTRGYLDPEYYIMQKLTDKSDVYSFGIVLLELITGKHAIIKRNGEETIHIVQWVQPMLNRGDINDVVDQRLGDEYDVNSIWKALELAMTCTRSSAIQRESMSFVLQELKECLSMEMVLRNRSSSSTSQSTTTRASSTYYVSNSSTEVFTGDVDSISGISSR